MSETLTIILSVIGVNVALFAALTGLVLWAINKLDTDVKSDIKSIGSRMDTLGNRLDGHATRIDQLYKIFIEEMKAQASRTDRLYQMFIDLLNKK